LIPAGTGYAYHKTRNEERAKAASKGGKVEATTVTASEAEQNLADLLNLAGSQD